MRLCLFIGHHKVGSTALQDFLWRNAARLLEAGILYPAVESEGLARLARQIQTGEEPDPVPMNAREAHNALAFRMLHEAVGYPIPPWHPNLPGVAQMGQAIASQIRSFAPRTVILCAEVFANFGALAPRLIGDLGGFFEGAEVSLHCTLRRPDQYLASWHGQRLRFGARLEPLRKGGLAPYLGTIHADYRLMLEPWIEGFPGARLSLRNYAEVLAVGGSVADFLSEARLDLPPAVATRLLPERRSNESLHPALLEFARVGALRLPPSAAAQLTGALLTPLPGLILPPKDEIELFGRANRQRLLDAFRGSDGWLRARGGRPFFPALATAAEPLPRPEPEVARALRPALAAALAEGGHPAALSRFVETLEIPA